jgi:hypothetical protein
MNRPEEHSMPRHAGHSRLALIKHESHRRFEDSALDAANSEFPEEALERDRWQEEVIELLNDALSPELVCVLRYRPQDRADLPASLGAALSSRNWEADLPPAGSAQARADAMAERIANRIVDRIMEWEQGAARSADDPDRPVSLRDAASDREPAQAADAAALRRAEQQARRHFAPPGDKDPAMKRMRDDSLFDDEEHADDWMAR